MTAEDTRVPSLYEWLGGGEVLKTLMVKFYERVAADDLLRPLFGEMPADHPQHVADFVGEVMGGVASIHGEPRRTLDDAGASLWAKHLGSAATTVGEPAP